MRLFSILLVVILVSCKAIDQTESNIAFIHNNELRKVKFEFDQFNYHLDKGGWKANLVFENDDYIYYTLEQSHLDTLKNLAFYSYPDNRFKEIESYIKSYETNGVSHQVEMRVDTFYYFTVNNNKTKTFHKGEYNYKFQNLLMKPEEIEYYLENIDSLSKVKGNNLPSLPVGD